MQPFTFIRCAFALTRGDTVVSASSCARNTMSVARCVKWQQWASVKGQADYDDAKFPAQFASCLHRRWWWDDAQTKRDKKYKPDQELAEVPARAASAPPRLAYTPSSEQKVANADISHSSGCCAVYSPKSVVAGIKVRYTLLSTWMRVTPLVEVTDWKGHTYCAVYWHPSSAAASAGNPPRGVMRSHKWHTTLVRAWSSASLDIHHEAWAEIINRMLALLLQPLSNRDGDIWTTMDLPPAAWRYSWNLGVPRRFHSACIAIERMLCDLIASQDPYAFVVRTDQDSLHISLH